MKFEIEKFSAELMSELFPLMAASFRENPEPGIPELKVNWGSYICLFNAGMLEVMVVRDGEKAVGLAAIIIVPNFHNHDIISALIDTIFLSQEYRKGSNGIRMISELDRISHELGADQIRINVRPTNDFSKLLKRKGYELSEESFTRRL